MPSLESICTSIEARIADVRREIGSLEAARGALLSEDGFRPQSGKPRRRISKSPGRSRTSKASPSATSRGSVAEPGFAAPAMVDGQPAETALRPRRTRSASPRARAKKRVEVLTAEKLEAMVREAGDGLSAAQIAGAANARAGQVRALLGERQAAGQVRRVGTGRGTRWRWITDEERIAERAAELAERAGTAS